MQGPLFSGLYFYTAFVIGMVAVPQEAGALSASEATGLFQSANGDFEAGKFEEAAHKYHQLAEAGQISAELFFNLGTTKYRLGQNGEAILWMKRALVIDPDMPEVRQSLTFLRSRIGFFEFAHSRLDRIIASLPPTFGKWATSLAIWISLLLMSLAFSSARLRDRRSTLITVAIIAAMAAFVSFRVGHHRTTRVGIESFSTITGTGANALTAPVPDAKAVVELPPGSEVRILRDSGGWKYAEIPGDLRGWIRSELLQPIWPLPLSKTSS